MCNIVRSSIVTALIASLGTAIVAPTTARAQAAEHPGERLSFVVGFAAGGFADTIARWVATRMSERIRQTVVVQNMEGGGGMRAARRVAMSPPDGTTILVTTTSLAINETLVPDRGYTATSLEAIALPVSAPESLSTSIRSPIKTLAELVNAAKAGTVFMGTAGIGTGSHIAGEYFFKAVAKAPVKHIPFPGGNPAMMGLLQGDVTVLAATATALVRNVNNGDVTGLGIAATTRSPMLPSVPTYAEAGWGLWASGRSGLKIDLGARTNLYGLLAAGSVAKNDATGTHASAGSPTAFCKVSGWHAGETAATESRQSQHPVISTDVLSMLQEQALGPLHRMPAAKRADDLHDDLARLEASVVNGMTLNADKLSRMLRTTDDVQDATRSARADDLHDLVKLHEARNVAVCSGAVYRSALDRTESREQFFREDFPMTDPGWFCWHGATLNRNGDVVFDRESFPTEGNRFAPQQPETAELGPIGAIIRGEHQGLVHP
jgi:tripartite-type tricarboxylate transporter receptor subunit TctC